MVLKLETAWLKSTVLNLLLLDVLLILCYFLSRHLPEGDCGRGNRRITGVFWRAHRNRNKSADQLFWSRRGPSEFLQFTSLSGILPVRDKPQARKAQGALCRFPQRINTKKSPGFPRAFYTDIQPYPCTRLASLSFLMLLSLRSSRTFTASST